MLKSLIKSTYGGNMPTKKSTRDKQITQEEQNHIQLGMDLLRKFNKSLRPMILSGKSATTSQLDSFFSSCMKSGPVFDLKKLKPDFFQRIGEIIHDYMSGTNNSFTIPKNMQQDLLKAAVYADIDLEKLQKNMLPEITENLSQKQPTTLEIKMPLQNHVIDFVEWAPNFLDKAKTASKKIPPRTALFPPTEEIQLKTGDQCVIKNLKIRKDLNGSIATVIKYDPTAKRYAITTEAGSKVKIKPGNLVALPPAQTSQPSPYPA